MAEEIRAARPDEAPALSAMALRSKAHWGYDDAFMQACVAELTVTPRTIETQPVFVLDAAGTLAGFYGLERIDETRVELYWLFVDLPWIGKGAGTKLLAHAITAAQAGGFRRMIIQSDPNAERFYLRAGATRVGERYSASHPERALPLLELPLLE
jgi:GNAT superfamily N-acetyltransferase